MANLIRQEPLSWLLSFLRITGSVAVSHSPELVNQQQAVQGELENRLSCSRGCFYTWLFGTDYG